MRYVIVGLILSIYSLFAIELSIRPDKNVTVSLQDIDAIKSYLIKGIKFHISDQGARRLVEKNRVLANEYIKHHTTDKELLAYLKVMIEYELANRMVKEYQREHKISEKTLLSYYKDHIESYKLPDKVTFLILSFDDYEKAIDFYKKYKDKKFPSFKILSSLKKKELTLPVNKLSNSIRRFIYPQKQGYFLPPLYLKKPSVLYVKQYVVSHEYKPFSLVKDQIRKKLEEKTFLRYRNQLLKKYGVL